MHYRLLPTNFKLSKLAERVIVDNYLPQLSCLNLMSKFQCAYREFHYCETALLRVQILF